MAWIALFFLGMLLFFGLLFYLASVYGSAPVKKINSEEKSKFELAVQAWNKGDMEKSEHLLNEFLKMEPDSLSGYLHLCKIYKKQDRQDALINIYRHLLNSGSFKFSSVEEAVMRRELADFCFNKQLWEEAFCNYLQTQKHRPDNFVRARLAFLQASQGKIDQAMVTFTEILALEPDNREWARYYVYCLMAGEMWEEASERLLDMISSHRDYPEYYYLLGRCFWHMGKTDLCRNYLKQFLRYPAQDRAFVLDAFVLVLPDFYYSNEPLSAKKNTRFWITIFETVMSISRFTAEQTKELLWQLGFLFFFCGDPEGWERARGLLKSVQDIDPEYKEVSKAREALADEDENFDFAAFYAEHRTFELGKFGAPKNIEYQDLFMVRKFDIDTLQNSFSAPDFFKKFFMGRNKLSVPELLSLPIQQFELRMAQAIKKMGWKIRKTCDRGGDGMTFKYIAEGDDRELRLVVLYRSEMTIGEIELNNILAERTERGVEGILAISLGIFSPDARNFSKKNNIVLITGEQLLEKL